MKSQNTIFKWIAIPILLTVLFSSVLISPSVSAQDELPATPTSEPTEEPVVDDFPEPTPQTPLEETESFQAFSALAVATPSLPDADCSDGRCVFYVKASTDDAGIHPSCGFSTSINEVYMGQCTNGQSIVSGFRFPNVNIPAGTVIQNAYIEFTVDGPYTDDLNVIFYGQASGNASTFSNFSRPNSRPVTTASVLWHIPSTEPWSLDQIKDSPSLTPIVQEIINRPDWVSGNAIALILRNVGPSSGVNKHRRVIGYDRFTSTYGAANAARLVIELEYKCDDYEGDLSPIAQAVFNASEGNQNFCLNKFENLTFIEDATSGRGAFEEFAELISEANYEVDFTTMIWDQDKLFSDGAGKIMLQGVKELYDQVVDDITGKYSNGVTVRILLGLQYYILNGGEDQRVNVIKTLYELGVPLEDSTFKWKIEVATYNESSLTDTIPTKGIHSHVKMLIVDGKEMIASGYNVQNSYVGDNPKTDTGIHVSGPIAQNALSVFDELWTASRICNGIIYLPETQQTNCSSESENIIEHLPDVTTISITGTDNVFSLYRDNDEKSADEAIEAALSASTQEVLIIQNRFFENAPPFINILTGNLYNRPDQQPATFFSYDEDDGEMIYTKGVLAALNNGADINIILSGTEKNFNTASLMNLMRLMKMEGISLQSGQKFCAKLAPSSLHTKALSLDSEFVIVGSQNFDFSAFGNIGDNINGGFDLAEYNLGVDDSTATDSGVTATFKSYFDRELGRSENIKFVFPALAQNEDWENIINCDENQNLRSFAVQVSPQTVQAVISQAEPGSYIILTPGHYSESVIVDKPLTIYSLEPSLVNIEPPAGQPAFQVQSDNVTITDLTISNSTTYGIIVQNDSVNDFENIYMSNILFKNNNLGGVLFSSMANDIYYILENNTFVGGKSGVSIDIENTLSKLSIVRNNLFSGQAIAPIKTIVANDGGVEYSHNLFTLCSPTPDCQLSWYFGNLHSTSSAHDNLFNLDPKFMDIGNDDFSLSLNSPILEAGDNTIIDGLLVSEEYMLPVTTIGAFETASVSTRPLPPIDDVPDLSGLVNQNSLINTNLHYFISASQDEDWFRFYINSTSSPQIHLNSLPANYNLYIYNSAGQLIGSSTKDKKSAEVVKLNNLPLGYYYIRVVGVNGVSDIINSYQLRINVPGH